MSGVLGALNQKQDVYQAIYVNNKDKASAITINVLNKTNQLARITLAISVSGTNPSDAEFIEYEAELPPKGVLERMGILVNPGQYVVSKSSIADVNVVVYGVENGGDGETPLSIITNTGINPTYSTGSLLTNAYAANDYSLQLEADPGEETQSLSYSIIAGSLPPGLSMDSLGLISGTVSGAGYTPGKADDVYAFIARASDTGGAYVDRAFFLRVKWADGSSSDLAAPSATAIKNLTATTTSGIYWIKPTGYSGAAFEVYCDMSTDNGGWMHVGTIADNNEAVNNAAHVWSDLNAEQDTGLWENSSTYGSQSFTADFKSQGWISSPFSQFLVKDQGNTQRNLFYTQDGMITSSNESFSDFWGSLSWGTNGSENSNSAYDSSRVRGVPIVNFNVNDAVLESYNKNVILLKFGERDGVQDSNKDRTMIAWHRHNQGDNVDSPNGLGCFTNRSGSIDRRDIVPTANRADFPPNSISGAPFQYTLWVR